MLTAGVLLLVASAAVFALLELAPGDAATQALGPRATAESLAALRAEYGLDRPAAPRYLEWLGGLPGGDLGESVTSGRPVADVLTGPLARTLTLGACAGVGVLVLGVGGGIAAGVRPGGRRDQVLSRGALIGLGTPEFVAGTVLVVVFALGLGWFPAVSLLPASGSVSDRPEILVLPALAISVVAGGYVLRLVRAVVAAHADAPHVEAARLDGIAPLTVLVRHLLPAALGPIVGAVAVVVPYLVGGTVVVENVFAYPGLGQTLVTAVTTRDQILLQGVAMLLATCTAAAYLVADVVARAVDPRRTAPA